jgi:hypothetical protein
MKTYVSYVIQDDKGHVHKAEVVETKSPPYTFNSDPQVIDVIEWAEEKKKVLQLTQELVLTGMYKI